MEKHIGRYSYLLGLICVVIAIVWRGLIAVGLSLPERVGHVYYETFLKAAGLLLLLAIASAAESWQEGH